jgi:hypothetical protein
MCTISATSRHGPTLRAGCEPLAVVRSDDRPLHSAVGIAADGPPAANDVASPTHPRIFRQRDRGFRPGVVLAALLLQPNLTDSRLQLQGVEVVRLLVGLQGPVHAVSPCRDDGFIRALGMGRDGLDHNGRGSHGSRGHRSSLLADSDEAARV